MHAPTAPRPGPGFVDVTRASAHFGDHGLARPLAILLAWAVGGGVLTLARYRLTRRQPVA